MINLIYDEEELKRFISLLPDKSSEDEAYFISLSARNKYLTDEERKIYELGRTEMLAQNIVSNKESLMRHYKRFCCMEGGYTTKNGKSIPDKTLVCYTNLFTSSGIKALQEFNEANNNIIFEMAIAGSNGNDITGSLKAISKSNKRLIDCYQRNKGTSKWIDVDFDIPKDSDFLNVFRTEMLNKCKELEYFIIETKSGYHFCFNRKTVKFNYTELVYNLNDELSESGCGGEIVINKNLMVPTAGTLQGGFPVRIIEIWIKHDK